MEASKEAASGVCLRKGEKQYLSRCIRRWSTEFLGVIPQRDGWFDTVTEGVAAIGTQKGYLVGNLFGHRGRHIGLLLGNLLVTDW